MTDSERCTQIESEIAAAVVTYTLESGEVWKKGTHIVYIPEKDFRILRTYHEWERIPSSHRGMLGAPTAMEQEVQLPKCNVRNGGDTEGIKIAMLQGDSFQHMQAILKSIYMPQIASMLNQASPLLKMMEDDDDNQ